MSDESVLAEARNFLQLFSSDLATGEKPLAVLVETLDRLAIVHGRVSERKLTHSGSSEAPSADYDHWRAMALRAFPSLGQYACVTPQFDATEVTLADAHDDIADIACDLQTVIWHWQNTTADDAIWCFRFGYQSHWGRHLMNLRSHLHQRMFET